MGAERCANDDIHFGYEDGFFAARTLAFFPDLKFVVIIPPESRAAVRTLGGGHVVASCFVVCCFAHKIARNYVSNSYGLRFSAMSAAFKIRLATDRAVW